MTQAPQAFTSAANATRRGDARDTPLTFVIAPVLLAAAALLACCVPARRAAGISPVVALGR